MPAVTRELSITYGDGLTAGQVVGGATNYVIDGKITIEKGYSSGRVKASVVVCGDTTEAAFAASCLALETAWRTPRQRVRVVLGSQTLIDWDPSTTVNTGFNADPSIEKAGDDVDTARSRRYEVSVTVILPADLSGQNGLRDSTIEIGYTPSRKRTVTIRGMYTALTTKQAFQRYRASIGAYATAVLAALTDATTGDNTPGTFELTSESADRGDTDKECNFSRTYEELIYPQGATATSVAPDDAALVNTVLTLTRMRTGPGDSLLTGPSAQRLVTMIAQVDTYVDKTVTVDLQNVWETKLKPWTVSKSVELGQMGASAVTEEQMTFDPVENRIQGTVTIVGVSGSSLLEADLSVEVDETSGLIFVPVWDGNRFAHYEYGGHATKTRVITQRRRFTKEPVRGKKPAPANIGVVAKQEAGVSPDGAGQGLAGAPGVTTTTDSGTNIAQKINESQGDGWRPVSSQRHISPKRIGIVPYTFDVMEETITFVETYITKPASAGTGGGMTVVRGR